MPDDARNRKRLVPLFAITGAALAIIASPSLRASQATRSVIVDAAHGSTMVRARATTFDAAPPESTGSRSAAHGDGVLWTNHVESAVYTTAAIAMSERRLVAGTYLNPPREAQLFPLEGPAVPEWTLPGTRFEVAAARDADALAGVDLLDQTVTLHKWHSGLGAPEWSYEIPQSNLAQFRSVAVSPDGSTVAALVTYHGGEEIQARLLYFDAGSSTPLGVFDAAQGTFARNLAMSADGAVIAFIATATLYVVERDSGALRDSFSMGATNDPLAISGDGAAIVYGWSSLVLRTWNGSSYGLTWSRSGGGRFLSSCAVSTDGSTLVAGWRAPDFDRNRVELFELPSATPAWVHDDEPGAGQLQDIPRDIAVTADGSYAAVAAWGDDGNTNAEVQIFGHAASMPVLSVDTPGSMFDVDIARGPGGVVHVAAAGKHVHANTIGSGGDLYSIRVQSGCRADLDGAGGVGFQDLLLLLAAWGPCGACVADLDDDGAIDFQDLLMLLAAWGPCG